MSEAPIPAWKRAGLKRNAAASQKVESYDPLKEGLKRVHESGESKKPAKPPKKPKVAKSERPAPTFELDQLAYLRQYTEDRDNWKFSKQKQNWILKHMFTDITDEKYDEPLLNYVNGLQGASRNWVAEDSRKIVDEWNAFMLEEPNNEGEEPVETAKESSKNSEERTTGDSGTEAQPEQQNDKSEKEDQPQQPSGDSVKPTKKKKRDPAPAPQKKIPTEKMARRAQTFIKAIANEDVKLELLDADEEKNSSS